MWYNENMKPEQWPVITKLNVTVKGEILAVFFCAIIGIVSVISFFNLK